MQSIFVNDIYFTVNKVWIPFYFMAVCFTSALLMHFCEIHKSGAHHPDRHLPSHYDEESDMVCSESYFVLIFGNIHCKNDL